MRWIRVNADRLPQRVRKIFVCCHNDQLDEASAPIRRPEQEVQEFGRGTIRSHQEVDTPTFKGSFFQLNRPLDRICVLCSECADCIYGGDQNGWLNGLRQPTHLADGSTGLVNAPQRGKDESA